MSSEASQPLTDFGPNEWLVDELYQKYLSDPNSVDKAWWNFFADYKSGATTASGASAPTTGAAKAGAGTANGAAPGAATRATAGKEPAAAAPRTAPAKPATPAKGTGAAAGDGALAVTEERLRGAPARTAANMESSLALPTATSVRAVPVKLLFDNRIVINNHLRRGSGGKVSFTHLIGYAMVKALAAMPEMNHSYVEIDGKPGVAKPEHVNFGLAIDLKKPDGTRQLLVPSIKAADTMDFKEFWTAYEDLVRKARANKLGVPDFQGTTISLTNPGGIGTVHSVPRLMPGQGTIVGVGAMEYPAEFQGMAPATLNDLAVSKVMTLTSTYDHRIIQGAQSGEFLRRIHQLLLGEDGFFDEIFAALRIPYEPVRWTQDISVTRDNQIDKASRVQELIHAYRVRGHLMADTDPLEYTQRRHPDLDVLEHGLTLWDLEREFPTGGFGGKPVMKLRDILGVLRDTYCRTVGIEYMHIQSPEEREWIQAHVEREHEKVSRGEQLHILRRLNNAEAFETFLQTKYVGQKRFSLEGGESLIPLLDGVISKAAKAELDEVVIGMAHRGRLNVLANICGKSYGQIFGEFEGNLDPRSAHGSGDVKYHLGTEGVFETPDGDKIAISLAANPSHLETVNPVAEGIVRAKQDLLDKGPHGFTVLPILIHGDAAFAGQGVVAETLNLSQLRGYRTGGTVHVIVNNQVGFTTSPADSRSSVYATDVARMVQAPIFHVNGDDPEAVVRVAQLGFAYRQAFNKDVVIDLVCYRRRGHNETDNPSFTQPLMYDVIDAKRSTRKLYTEALIGRGDISVEEAEQALRDYQQQLERAFTETREADKKPIEPGAVIKPEVFDEGRIDHAAVETAISDEVVKQVVETQIDLPEGFTPHPRLQPQLQRRAQMVQEDTIDWGMGETLALGSLLIEGHPVRLVGQDSRRGTFGQRHAALVDRNTGEVHVPLKRFEKGTSKFHVHDSLLSEYAALGFEYGYSVIRPEALVAWEAQFGDFVNGAQSVIDEYISASEQKWGQRSSVTLLLPHGYEGQGPDHSSARIERFLQLCAQENMTVALPTTPANYFHLLRWQVKSPYRRPLVVFTPKSMLRLKAAASATSEFTTGSFQPIIPDTTGLKPEDVRRVVLCSGKVYYDLDAARRRTGDTSTAVIRVERLYPLPIEEIRQQLAAFPNAGEVLWVQEEPANMGPWPFVALVFSEQLDRPFTRISRPASSSPAAGSAKRHEVEQQALVNTVFPPTD
ncbi:multifunctional oxoglutarate decarboxylase/oxoglutarate dehydrogenase thiamine pyrophosphate-binding subunit/dihydrolipoyllysine-residue succinyltransferase subunit [Marinitenerispora sediminis]|uniref:Multifunctional oxoglutarate decarboxylase/oxoglutarate dehydrogenase thiamine pyrophosphate-binding subunit/dihydrolipoyllysine-residue succinyltransferase subunit n=1 Tax=Marinitenerispora sediminis TaxID=1931232 RepID=A0A368T7Y4_9ACTN|nr:multifunctional oxoglutarate decarboxylase/oxoglutarate dehydrogenase thiamine pyrophosphate-binding subunit/dihydrolipoyllysine-residue succinyltransferase subunit [Marinitenerispora sediminis]RCV51124.1 multifunctional oxoglutarate decarboxylase/oxoglutarate dehydrogenase thiamine pyrophosphate-binding subunit/dihydrolipoyllysine-residue succinyltransferase subunit [Marinitenerispora sediminis]RCV58339.1 multifunctional oxoglutarate decarboxylase/oxoglutarate dehydrogenase thiamine pyrophosp